MPRTIDYKLNNTNNNNKIRTVGSSSTYRRNVPVLIPLRLFLRTLLLNFSVNECHNTSCPNQVHRHTSDLPFEFRSVKS